jgi:predicted small lipoprotein YifL
VSMRKFVIAATCFALAGCGLSEVEAPEAEAEDAEAQEFTLDSTAMGNIAGTYEVKFADGSVSMQTINPDGTYVDTTPDGTRIGGGTWRTGDNGTMCFDPEGNDPEECYTGGAPGEDGAFEMRGEDGTVQSSVRKVEAQAMAAPSE